MALRSQGNWRWEGPLGTPLGLCIETGYVDEGLATVKRVYVEVFMEKPPKETKLSEEMYKQDPVDF